MSSQRGRCEARQRVIFALVVVLLFSNLLETGRPYVSAKSSSSAGKWTLTVSVVDQLGESVQGQEVKITNYLGEEIFNGHTNKDGFVKPKLEAGEYRVLVQDQSYTIDLTEDTDVTATVTVDLPIAVEGAS